MSVTENSTNCVKPVFLTSDTTYQSLRVDRATHTLQTIDYEHHEIHSGSHFFVAGFMTAAASATVDFAVTTPNTTTWAHMTFEVGGTSQTEMYIYEGLTATGGTSAAPINNDRNSSTNSVLTVIMNPGVATLGTMIFSSSSGLAGATPVAADQQGLINRQKEIILKQNERYLFRIRSLDAANVVNYIGEWYEHANRTA